MTSMSCEKTFLKCQFSLFKKLKWLGSIFIVNLLIPGEKNSDPTPVPNISVVNDSLTEASAPLIWPIFTDDE